MDQFSGILIQRTDWQCFIHLDVLRLSHPILGLDSRKVFCCWQLHSYVCATLVSLLKIKVNWIMSLFLPNFLWTLLNNFNTWVCDFSNLSIQRQTNWQFYFRPRFKQFAAALTVIVPIIDYVIFEFLNCLFWLERHWNFKKRVSGRGCHLAMGALHVWIKWA